MRGAPCAIPSSDSARRHAAISHGTAVKGPIFRERRKHREYPKFTGVAQENYHPHL
jgi:hypothetical protein